MPPNHSRGVGVRYREGGERKTEIMLTLLPIWTDTIPLKTILVPTEIGPGPFGAKAVGETINAGVHPAIVNVVRDAVGVRIQDLPRHRRARLRSPACATMRRSSGMCVGRRCAL